MGIMRSIIIYSVCCFTGDFENKGSFLPTKSNYAEERVSTDFSRIFLERSDDLPDALFFFLLWVPKQGNDFYLF